MFKKFELENNSYVNKFNENVLKDFVLENKTYEIKKIVNENYKFSKSLLNDFENISDIKEYLKKYENDYYDLNENSINVYFEKSIIFEQIPTKKLFIDYLDNIEKIILCICSVLKENITYNKHIKQLYFIEYFLKKMSFNENVYYNYYFSLDIENKENNSYENYCLEKFLIKNYLELEYNIKNVYKILKYSYDKILKILYNIIENHNFKGVNFDFENF